MKYLFICNCIYLDGMGATTNIYKLFYDINEWKTEFVEA